MRRDRHLSDADLLEAIDASAPAPVRQRVDAHLGACDVCQRRLAALQAADRTIDRSFGAWTTAGVRTGDLRRRLGERLIVAASAPRARWWRVDQRVGIRSPIAWIEVIAAVIAVIAAVHTWPAGPLSSVAAWTEASDLPRPSLTPGATSRATATELCTDRLAGPGPIADVTRQRVVRAYGMERVSPAEYELDYLITPELGGTSDAANLWPERYASRVWNARVKDQLEDLLPHLVCQGQVDLTTAQRDIAANWIVAYKKYFRTDRPLPGRGGASAEGGDDGGGNGAAPAASSRAPAIIAAASGAWRSGPTAFASMVWGPHVLAPLARAVRRVSFDD